MQELKVFENKEFGQVRIIEVNGTSMFVANDVAKALGYSNPSKATNDHCKKAQMAWGNDSLGRRQEFKVIPEGDLYRLITHSKLESAERFENWVYEEVIPSVRKHGAYMTDEVLERAITSPDFLIRLATELKEARAAKEEVDRRNTILIEDVKRMKPKEIFADAVDAADTCILIGELAKILKQNGVNIGQNRLFEWMRQNSYLISRKGTDYNMPTQKSMELGLFEIKERTINNPDGSVRITKTVLVTGKGQQYFINKFLNNTERSE